MHWAAAAKRLGCMLLLLSLYGSTLIPSAEAHRRHNARLQGGISVQQAMPAPAIQDPPRGALSAACVPKYAIDLILPPPMPNNTAPRPKGLAGPGCYDFSKTRPPHCSFDGDTDVPVAVASAEEEPEVTVHLMHKDPDSDNQYRSRRGHHHISSRRHKDSSSSRHHHDDNASEAPASKESTPSPAEAKAPAPETPTPQETPKTPETTKPQEPASKAPETIATPQEPTKSSEPVGFQKPSKAQEPTHSHKSIKSPDAKSEQPSKAADTPSAEPPAAKEAPALKDKEAPAPKDSDGSKAPSSKPHTLKPKRSRHFKPPRQQIMRPAQECGVDSFKEYQISVKPHTQRSLPDILPLSTVPAGVTCPTTRFGLTDVFAYGPTNGKSAHYNWPAFTIESLRYQPNRIQWNNELVDPQTMNYVPHIIKEAVDQTLHWANPQALGGSIDDSPCHACTGNCQTNTDCVTAAAADTYDGPVPIVTHVHGMEDVRDYSDGYTEAWYLPDAKNNAGYYKVGTWYDTFEKEYRKETCQPYSKDGSADYIYPNTQRPATAWYHDHTLGITRLNVYAVMAGFYLVRKFFPEYYPGVKDTGPELPGLPYPAPGGALNPADVRELPLAIQDRMFRLDGSLWYPVKARDSGVDYPVGVQPPLWLPEFPYSADVGDVIMMTVNGRVWPKTTIKPDTYRMRLLNGCNARVLKLHFAKTLNTVTQFDYTAPPDPVTILPFWVIGNEAGYFPQAQAVTELTFGPAERYDVIVDFSGVQDNEYVYMFNSGPEEPFVDGTVGTQTAFATEHTSQLMRFEFDSTLTDRPSAPFDAARRARLDAALAQEVPKPLPPTARRRQMALLEENNPTNPAFVKAVLLGNVPAAGANGVFTATPQLWTDDVTATTPVDTVEEWDIINLTPDAHPIHLHEVVYETISRTAITVDPANPLAFTDNPAPNAVTNPLIDPLLWVDCPLTFSATGKCPAQRDVSLVLPGTRTTIRFKAGRKPGLFVWHCHIVEHEDNEMMVPWCVGPPAYTNPKTGAPMCPPQDNLLVPPAQLPPTA